MALIAEAGWPSLVVAMHEDPYPGQTIARHFGALLGGLAMREQPNALPVTPFCGILALAIAGGEFVKAEMGLDKRTLWHASSIPQDLI